MADETDSRRSGVSRETAIQVVVAAVDATTEQPTGRFQTKALDDRVNVSAHQCRKVLAALEESGYVHYDRNGRTGHWVVEDFGGGFGLPAPPNEFYEQFSTMENIRAQRARYLYYKNEVAG